MVIMTILCNLPVEHPSTHNIKHHKTTSMHLHNNNKNGYQQF